MWTSPRASGRLNTVQHVHPEPVCEAPIQPLPTDAPAGAERPGRLISRQTTPVPPRPDRLLKAMFGSLGWVRRS